VALAPANQLSPLTLDQLCINSIRVLAMDAVQMANSGHPGMPMGMAPTAYLLFTRAYAALPAQFQVVRAW
jgi:transketolase